MIRKVRILGMAFIAVLALSAVGASAASAEGKYTASSYTTTGTAVSELENDTFTTEAGVVKCKSHFEATLTEASADLTVKAKYTNCSAFGFAAEVKMNSCDYTFTTPTKTGTADVWTIKVDVRCTGAPIQIIAGPCEVTVGEQNPIGHVIATNTTAVGDVDVDAHVTGINYTVVKDGFLCPFNGTGAKGGATYIQHQPVTFDSTNGAAIHIG